MLRGPSEQWVTDADIGAVLEGMGRWWWVACWFMWLAYLFVQQVNTSACYFNNFYFLSM